MLWLLVKPLLLAALWLLGFTPSGERPRAAPAIWPSIPGISVTRGGAPSAGVSAGSLAAAWQSMIGDVAAGSLFAILQAIAAAAW